MEERDSRLLDHSYSKKWEEGVEGTVTTPTHQSSNFIAKLDASQDNFENILFSLLKTHSVQQLGHRGQDIDIVPQALDTLSNEQVNSLITSNSINYLAVQELITQRNKAKQQKHCNGQPSTLTLAEAIPTTTPTMTTPSQSGMSIQISPTQLKQLQIHVSELLRQHNVQITDRMTSEQQQLIINSLITQQATMTMPPLVTPTQSITPTAPPAPPTTVQQAPDAGDIGVSAHKRKKDDKSGRTPTPFNLFFHDIYPTIQQEHPNVPFAEASRIVSATWNTLGQEKKQKYYDQHEKLKEESASKQQHTKEDGSGQLYSDTEGSGIKSTDIKPKRQRRASREDPPTSSPGVTKEKGMCVSGECTKPAIFSEDRGDMYCSNECVVKHAKYVFSHWLVTRKHRT